MPDGLSPYYNKAVVIPQTSLAAASITSSYKIVTSIFGSGVKKLIIVSSLDGTIQLSLDGSTDFIPLIKGGTLIIDADDLPFSGAWGVYVKTIDSVTTGSVYVGALGV